MKKIFVVLALVSGLALAQTVVYNTDTVTIKNPDGSVTKQVWALTYTNGRMTARTLQSSLTTGGAQIVNAEYNQTALATKQNVALGRGLTGAGSTILIMDSGIDVTHKEFANKIKYSIDYTGTGLQDKVGHGTHVAGIAAASLNNVGMFGVAPGADLAIAKITNTTLSNRGNAQKALVWAQQYNDIVVANLSSSTNYDNNFLRGVIKLADGTYYNPTYFNGLKARGHINPYYNGESPNSWANSLGKEMVLVIAAGNQSTGYVNNPGIFATSTDANGNLLLGGRVIIAGNYNTTTNRINGANAGTMCRAVVNNLCTDRYRASDFYLLAPGTGIYSTSLNGTYRSMSGTSQAAPAISGAVAVVHQLWPYMKGDQIVQLLLKTANKNLPGYTKETHGQGLLDLDKATQPVGSLGISTTGRTGNVTPVTGTLAVAGLSSVVSSKLVSVSVVDELQRGYQVNLTPAVSSRFVEPTAYIPHSAGQGWSSRYAGQLSSFNGVTVGSGAGTTTVGVSTQAMSPVHQTVQYQATFTQMQYNPWINFAGMWGESRDAVTLEFSAVYSPNSVGMYAQAGLMQTTGNYNYGMVSRVSPIYSTYAIAGYREQGFSVHGGVKPTVIVGSIDITIPTAVDTNGTMQYETVSSKIRNRAVGFVGTSYAYNYRAHRVSVNAMADQDGSYQAGVYYKQGF
jgi:subtilisin family serine protease